MPPIVTSVNGRSRKLYMRFGRRHGRPDARLRQHQSDSMPGNGCEDLSWDFGFSCVFDLHELPTEAAFDARVAAGHVVVQRRGHAYDLAVLLVHRKIAAHAAVGADGVRVRLPRFIPRAGLAHIVLALEHQGPGGTDANAVAAVHAG